MNTPVNPNAPGTRDSARPLSTSDLVSAGRSRRPESTRRAADSGRAAETGRASETAERTDSASAANSAIPANNSAPPADSAQPGASERLDPLFPAALAEDYRSRWTAVQSSFVDDPRQAVQQGDELVAQVMHNLAESFAEERQNLEGQLGKTGEAATETLRLALRRYRSFFERLLSM